MSVDRVRARIECDRCGHWFDVDIDTGEDIPNNWDLMDLATEAVRAGRPVDAQGAKAGDPLGFCSVTEDGDHLCGACTTAADAGEPT